MPTYVYECPEHGQFEVVKPMADSGREEWCPWDKGVFSRLDGLDRCGLSARRVYTPSALHTQGSNGDGYFFNKKSGLRSAGRGKR